MTAAERGGALATNCWLPWEYKGEAMVVVYQWQVSKVDPSLVAVNQALKGYQGAWDDLVDCWLVVRIGNPDWVYKWRLQVCGTSMAQQSLCNA